MPGTLYLIPNTLGDDDRESQLNHVLPRDTIEKASQLRYWIVENAKTARAVSYTHLTLPTILRV